MLFYLSILFLGLASPIFLSSLPSLWWPASVFTLSLFCIKKRIAKILLLFCLGFSFSVNHIQTIIDSQLPPALEGRDLRVLLEVNGQTAQDNRGMLRFWGKIKRVEHDEENSIVGLDDLLETNIRLSWRPKENEQLKLGKHYWFMVRLRRPRGFVNPHGFDYQAYLLHQGYAATGYVKSFLQSSRVEGLPSFHVGLRQHIATVLFESSNKPLQGILKALILGDRHELETSHWQVLSRTGTVHLMAISGLHVGLVALLGLWFGRVLCRVIGRSTLSMQYLFPAFCGASISLIYAAVSGFAIPTQRAWLMLVVFFIFSSLGRKISPLIVLLAVACVVVACDPFAALQQGFWLSLNAVACLVVTFSARPGVENKWRAMLSSQAVLFVGMLVVLASFNLPVSASAPIANLVAVPVISFVVVPLLILSTIFSFFSEVVSLGILEIAYFATDKLWAFLSWLSDWELVFYPVIGSVWLLMLGVVGGFFAIFPSPLGFRWFGVGLLLMALTGETEKYSSKISVLDVGQGLSIVLESQGEMAVYDVGAKFSENFDIGSRVVAPFIQALGYKKIDKVWVSHTDNDHAGGLEGLASSIPVIEVSANFDHPFGVRRSSCVRGNSWRIGEFDITAIWPTENMHLEDPNNSSCVLVVKIDGRAVLLTGDIEKQVERELLESGLVPADVDIVIAPHHGSRTSSSPDFVEHTSPDHVVFSAGFNNRYRHPSRKIVARYKQIDSSLWTTGEEGAITFEFEPGGEIHVYAERAHNPKPWYD